RKEAAHGPAQVSGPKLADPGRRRSPWDRGRADEAASSVLPEDGGLAPQPTLHDVFSLLRPPLVLDPREGGGVAEDVSACRLALECERCLSPLCQPPLGDGAAGAAGAERIPRPSRLASWPFLEDVPLNRVRVLRMRTGSACDDRSNSRALRHAVTVPGDEPVPGASGPLAGL